MKNHSSFIATCIALSIFVTTSHAQAASGPSFKAADKPSSIKVKPKRAVPPVPVFTPVFWQVEKSPLDYRTNDAASVMGWLEKQVAVLKSSLPKSPDSFTITEERDQYAVAVKNLTFQFSIPVDVSCSPTYDIERQAYTVQVRTNPLTAYIADKPDRQTGAASIDSYTLKLRRIFLGQYKFEDLGVYQGQNAYGATVEVTKERETSFFVAIPAGADNEPIEIFAQTNPSSAKYSESEGTYRFKIPMPPSQAREAADRIGCLSVISPVTPFLAYGSAYQKPTRDKPKEIVYSYHGLVGKLDHLIVFNKISGEVYARSSRAGM